MADNSIVMTMEDITVEDTTNASKNYAYANAGISAIGNIASSLLSVSANKAQIEAQTKATLTNMNNVLTSYEYTAVKLKQEWEKLDSMYADKISASTIDTMKKSFVC